MTLRYSCDRETTPGGKQMQEEVRGPLNKVVAVAELSLCWPFLQYCCIYLIQVLTGS